MLQVDIPPKITCNSDWRPAKTLPCEIRGLQNSHDTSALNSFPLFPFILPDSLYFFSLIICLCDLAGVHLLLPHARLTLDVAAPAYLTVAGQAGEPHGCVVAASAAQALAAGVFGAGPTAGTRGVTGGPAEAGGVLQVDQVGGAQALAVTTGPRQLCLPRGRVGDAQHSHRRIVSVLQQPPGVVERRQLLPASPNGAGARDAVTLAGGFQAALHRL